MLNLVSKILCVLDIGKDTETRNMTYTYICLSPGTQRPGGARHRKLNCNGMSITQGEISNNPRNVPGKRNTAHVEVNVFRRITNTWNE